MTKTSMSDKIMVRAYCSTICFHSLGHAADRLAVISRVRGKAPTPEPEGVRPIPLHLSHWHDDIFVA
jgi:hypothetical protein